MSHFTLSADNCWKLCLLFCLIAAMAFMPDSAAASTTDDGISTVLCLIVTKLTGPIGKTIGMIALVVLGAGIFLGKLSWPLALATALGITFIFSANKIINWLSAGVGGTDSCAVAS
jgi:type IV secretory pathway VirB2 component (pilin)